MASVRREVAVAAATLFLTEHSEHSGMLLIIFRNNSQRHRLPGVAVATRARKKRLLIDFWIGLGFNQYIGHDRGALFALVLGQSAKCP
jgi:hypothetical protein